MVLGIDLGTTYSVAAYLDENGNSQVVTNMEGSQTTPSVVYFENASSVVVGQTAKDNKVFGKVVKRLLEESDMGTVGD